MSVEGSPVRRYAPRDGAPVAGGDDILATAKRGFDAFSRRDVDDLLTLVAEDAELFTFRAALEGQTYTGHAGVRSWLADLAEDWQDWRVEDVSFRRAGNRVVVLGHVRARSRGTGVQFETPAGFTVEIEDGKITRLTSYGDPAEALKAAGLEP